MRKTLRFLAVAAALFFVLPAANAAAPKLLDLFEIDGIYYQVTKTTVPYEVRVFPKTTTTKQEKANLTIPSTVTNGGNTFTVTEIGASAFAFSSAADGQVYTLTGTVTLPTTIRKIGGNAFWNQSGITSINLSDLPLLTIDDHAFYECTGLTSIGGQLPSTVTTIGKGAFSVCSALDIDNFALPANLTTLGQNAFSQCASIKASNLKIPDTVTTLEDGVFSQCTGLTGTPQFPAGITKIPGNIFYCCTGLTGIDIPSTVTTIGTYAFYQCTGVTTCSQLPEGLVTIGSNAFFKCNKMVMDMSSLPSTLVTVESAAFWYCKVYGDVVFPEGLKTIGDNAFMQTDITSAKFPASIETLGKNAFNGCTKLTGRIDLYHTSLTSLGTTVFANTKITELDLPHTMQAIGQQAFQTSPQLRLVKIPNSVTHISRQAFGANALNRHISFPSRVTNLSLAAILTGKDYGTTSDLSKEITFPFGVTNVVAADYSSSLTPSSTYKLPLPVNLRKVYWLGNTIPDDVIELLSGYPTSSSSAYASGKPTAANPITVYVKPSKWKSINDAVDTKLTAYSLPGVIKVEYKIPVTFKAGARYTTLCRDFDIDLTANLVDESGKVSDGIKAYVPTSYNAQSNTIQLVEVDYIPSRTLANSGTTDYDGNDPYLGIDQYHGVILERQGNDFSSAATYYYTIGEQDYSKGKAGQMGVSSDASVQVGMYNSTELKPLLEKSWLYGLNDEDYVVPSETVDGVTYKYYGLAGGKVKEITYADWCAGYNKAIFRIPTTELEGAAAEGKTIEGFEVIDNPYANVVTVIDTPQRPAASNDESWYTLGGMRLNAKPTQKGVYIYKGKKVVI